MIPRIKTGSSFAGAGLYYLHDKNTLASAERVAWTHSLNTLHDEPEKVLREMQQTVANQNFLKSLSGQKQGGRPLEKPVMTIVLAWPKDQSVDQAHMIATGRSFLQTMGWSEHQALFVAHNDTAHPHVHLIVNRVHPETGKVLDDGFSQRRAQEWAHAYEVETGKICCPNRKAERGKEQKTQDLSLHPGEWQAAKKAETAAGAEAHTQSGTSSGAGDWQTLKETQRSERDQFWTEARQQIRSARRSVWKAMGGPELQRDMQALTREEKTMGRNAPGLSDRREALHERRTELRAAQEEAAQKVLEESRVAYRRLLDAQKEIRHGIGKESSAGHDASRSLVPTLNSGAFSAQDERDEERRKRQSSADPDSWTEKAGMAPQQKSAMGWLKAVQSHASKATSPSQGMDVTKRGQRLADKLKLRMADTKAKTAKPDKAPDKASEPERDPDV